MELFVQGRANIGEVCCQVGFSFEESCDLRDQLYVLFLFVSFRDLEIFCHVSKLPVGSLNFVFFTPTNDCKFQFPSQGLERWREHW